MTITSEPPTLFENATVLDTVNGVLVPARHVLVVDGRIQAVGDESVGSSEAAGGDDLRRIDLNGAVLMPGLCDGHVHVTAITADFATMQRWSPYYVALRASKLLEEMLMRGFTTVRDAGGADHGIARAVDEGAVPGPRILFPGRAPQPDRWAWRHAGTRRQHAVR